MVLIHVLPCPGNENDLVFDTFKEQQQQYQALLDGSKVSCRVL